MSYYIPCITIDNSKDKYYNKKWILYKNTI